MCNTNNNNAWEQSIWTWLLGSFSLNRHVIGYKFDSREYKCEQWTVFCITTTKNLCFILFVEFEIVINVSMEKKIEIKWKLAFLWSAFSTTNVIQNHLTVFENDRIWPKSMPMVWMHSIAIAIEAHTFTSDISNEKIQKKKK